jgi:tetratricopeptide (TPR) repeat protein
MAKAGTLTRKEMKAPDRFQVITGQAMSWVAARQKVIIALVGVAAVAIVAMAIAGSLSEKREKKAGGLLYKAFDALDGEISSVPLPGLAKPTFKTEEERAKAVIAAAEQVRKEYANTPAAVTAALAIGDAQLGLAQYDAALAAYEDFLKSAPKDDSLRFSAIEGVAHVEEAKGALDKAAETYDRLGKEAPFYKDRAALERARVLAKAGKTEEARKILEAFPVDFKDSQLKVAATEQLHRLAAK